MVNTIYLLSFVDTPRKYLRGVSTKLNKYKRGIITVKMLLLGMKAAENISYHSMHLFDSYLTR